MISNFLLNNLRSELLNFPPEVSELKVYVYQVSSFLIDEAPSFDNKMIGELEKHVEKFPKREKEE